MVEHLSNCHGEWNFLLAAVGSIPFIGTWLKYNIGKLRKQKQEVTGENR